MHGRHVADDAAQVHRRSGQNCISFSQDFKRIRVRVPRRDLPDVVRKDPRLLEHQHQHGRDREGAERRERRRSRAVRDGRERSGAGDYCLDSGGNGNSVAPCDGPTTGNFGVLSFMDCGLNSGLDDDLAAGADHVYTSNPTGMLADIPDDCSVAGPNTVLSDPGNRHGQETKGLLTGLGPFADGQPARLLRVPQTCSCVLPHLGSRERTVRIARRDRQSAAVGVHPHRARRRGTDVVSPRDVRRRCSRRPRRRSRRTVMHLALVPCITDYVASGAIGPGVHREHRERRRSGSPDLRHSVVAALRVHAADVGSDSGQRSEDLSHQERSARCSFNAPEHNNSSSPFEPGPWNGNTLPDNSAAYTAALVLPAPRSGCSPTPTDSCGTMLPGTLGSIGSGPTVIGANAVVELIG